MAFVTMDISQIERFEKTIKQVGDQADIVINEYLKNQGGNEIKREIQKILPRSGRTWKRKAPAASSVDPFKKTPINLGVKVHSTKIYHYLYFPDDGSNTKKHEGGQEFMLRGAQSAAPEIGENLINRLLDQLK